MGQDPLTATLRSLDERLRKAKIPYALVGGMALVAYGYVRATEDIDIVLTPEGLERFWATQVGLGYVPSFDGAKRMFRDTQTGMRIEILVSGEFPGDGKPKSISFPDPAIAAEEIDNLRVVSLNQLIELKLASGMTAKGRLKDLADVQELIQRRQLPRELADTLDASVRDRYLELWDDLH